MRACATAFYDNDNDDDDDDDDDDDGDNYDDIYITTTAAERSLSQRNSAMLLYNLEMLLLINKKTELSQR